MNCPNCGYDFDPTLELRCPRCGESVDCGSVSCESCSACTGPFGVLRRLVRSQTRTDETDSE